MASVGSPPQASSLATHRHGIPTARAPWRRRLYLAIVIDLASCRVVGWAVTDHLETDLVDAALSDALARRPPTDGLVFHSDHGCQYSSAQHARLAKRHGVDRLWRERWRVRD
ncbi:DDE-type integrase/transposase/recombinase [Catenuloplanes atrovinosus]|uniref:Transposase InsO family protein n=1 Tax=Catenuloplanes atrovinosus TaxID=137266 RepID=A0AAE3YSK0_9ACTN|nr:transposase InsO family protein [Catenuloplanes atrovinosus]